jgi:hypothetical protein
VVHATTTFSVGGVSLTRATGTGGLNSADAQKDYVSGSITIIKDAIPNAAVDFAFTTTGTGLSSFTLDDDADLTLSNTQAFNNLAPGAYTVTETLPVAGWTPTNLVCTGGGANTSTVTATGVATIGLDAGENVVCTYTNTKDATITITKEAIPDNAQDFSFTRTGTGWADFSLDDDGSAGTFACGGGDCQKTHTFTFDANNQGVKTITEDGETGWTLTNLTCSATGTGTTTDHLTPGSATATANITLAAGGAVTCTYTNTGLGTITIVKTALDGNGTFSYTHDVDGNSNPVVGTPFDIVTVAGTGQKQFLLVNPGTYHVTESGPPAGWAFVSLSCTAGGSNAARWRRSCCRRAGISPAPTPTRRLRTCRCSNSLGTPWLPAPVVLSRLHSQRLAPIR